MATVQRYVNTGSSGGDGTTNNTSGGTAAYASLSSWEANQSPSGTDDLVVDCCGSSADTTTVDCDWSTAPASVAIRANASDPAGKYNGTDLISTAHYRLSTGAGASALRLTEGTNHTIDGLQVETSGGSFRCGIQIGSIGQKTATIQNNRVRGTGATRTGIGDPGGGVGFDSQTITIANNIVVGFDVAQIEFLNQNFRSPTVNVYHNTVYGDGSSNLISINLGSGGSPVANIKNNCGWNSGATAELNVTGTGTKNYDENAFQDGNGTTNEITLTSSAATWVSAGTGQSADFTPVASPASQLLGAGATGLGITTDINGITRDSPPDIGAVEVAAGGGGGTTYSDAYSESVTADATLANTLTAVVTISEPVTLAAALSTIMTMPNAFTESITAGFSISDGNIFNDTLTETVTVAQTFANTMVFANTISEAVTLAELFATVGTFVNSLSEAVALADSYASGGGTSSIWTVVSPAGGTWTAVVPANTVWTPQ